MCRVWSEEDFLGFGDGIWVSVRLIAVHSMAQILLLFGRDFSIKAWFPPVSLQHPRKVNRADDIVKYTDLARYRHVDVGTSRGLCYDRAAQGHLQNIISDSMASCLGFRGIAA